MRCNLRQLYSENAVVSIHCMLKPMFPMKCHFRHTTLISEEKSHISVHHNLWKICRSVFQNRLKHSEHILRNRKFSCTGVCLRGFNVVFHTTDSLKLMVNVDDAVLQINILNGKSAKLRNSKAGVK